MDENIGWIKLYRKSIEGGWLKNHKLWVFWCWCLLKATHKNGSVIIGYQQIKLKPGQFIFGRKKAAKELKMSEQSIRTSLDFLKNAENLTIKPTNKFSIITICNWSTYQKEEKQDQPTTNQQLTNKQPTTNHIQECKEVKNKKKAGRFSKPNIEEIKKYAQSIGFDSLDSEYFFDKNESIDWKDKNGNKYKDWRAVVRTWKRWETNNKKDVKYNIMGDVIAEE